MKKIVKGGINAKIAGEKAVNLAQGSVRGEHAKKPGIVEDVETEDGEMVEDMEI